MMTNLVRVAGVLVLGAAVPAAIAERCIGPKDNSDMALNAGVPPISAADLTWCDDFDSYCEANCGDECNPAWPPHSVWPGYPPVPDNWCDPAGLDPGGGANDSSEFYYRRSYHWPRPGGITGGAWASSAPGKWPSRWEGWDGNPGWMTEAYSLQYQGGGNSNQYHTFSLDAAANQKFPGSDGLVGTDDNPLTLRYWATPGGRNVEDPKGYVESPPNLPFYVELRLDNDQAPTNWITAGQLTNPTVHDECVNQQVTFFPVVCQQRIPPAGCPPLSTQVHASLAFGWLAQLDANPCNVDTGRKPTQYHAAVFDGLKWHPLLASQFPGQVDKFNWDSLQAYFEMKVKSTTMEIKLIAYAHRPTSSDPLVLVTSTATVPREYLGSFNKISTGAAPGCQLDPNTGGCLTAGEYTPWRYMTGNSGRGWSTVYVDRIALVDGLGNVGACCLPDGGCTTTNPAACASAGGTFLGGECGDGSVCQGACCQPAGVCTQTFADACPGNFRGMGTSCATPSICPCPTPFADHDMDGDVDMNDFAGLQRCLTTGGGSILPGCECFDQNDSGAIDNTDIEKFVLCGTGENVPWTPTEDCPS
ncbi:MAG: hypothetical protein HY718_17030 [Planctomycetes bacterium]|nr:hypothetical protein [Planctomycetota bacterium]